jgi:Ca2+-transporting ATPase
MTTAGALGLTLALEQKEAGIMQRAPRHPQAPLLTRQVGARILLVGTMILIGAFGLFEWEEMRGASVAEARTMAVNAIVVMQLFYLFNCRSLTRSVFEIGVFSNRWILGGVALMIVLQLLFTYAPVMNLVFATSPIGLSAWGLATLAGVAAFAVVEVEKWLRRE